MKILKRGTPPGEIVHQATCNNCKTEVEFQQSEGRMLCDQREGQIISVTCPVCNSTIMKNITPLNAWGR